MIDTYFNELRKGIDSINYNSIEKSIEVILDAYKNNKCIFIMGNGGSASTASHFICDLNKGIVHNEKSKLRIMCLNDNIPLITALGNDLGYDKIFEKQIENWVNKGDIIIAISCSGNSPNIVNGISCAINKKAYIIGFTGFNGGFLKEKSNLNIHVNNYNYGQIENIHLIIFHYISQSIYNSILSKN